MGLLRITTLSGGLGYEQDKDTDHDPTMLAEPDGGDWGSVGLAARPAKLADPRGHAFSG